MIKQDSLKEYVTPTAELVALSHETMLCASVWGDEGHPGNDIADDPNYVFDF